jgi:small subunit ribosomal protein S1
MTDPRDTDSFAALFEAGPRVPARRSYRVGETLEVEVVRVTDTAVFVALDAKREGLIEAEDLGDPEQRSRVSVGARLAARVVEVDRSSGAVRLSPLSPEPLVGSIAPAASPPAGAPVVAGMRVKGKVASVERYGVFLELDGAEEGGRSRRGLIPVQELGVPRGTDLRKAFPQGKELDAIVLAVDDRRRIRLSVVALQAAEEQREYQDFAARAHRPPDRAEAAPRGAGFGTFADLMKRDRR